MKRNYTNSFTFSCLVFLGLCFSCSKLQAQCTNADFSDGNFTGWTGTYSLDQCTGTIMNGRCTCSLTNPYNTVGFNQGPNNDPANDAANEWSQIITTTAGDNDALITSLGGTMPVVWPGGSGFSARIGNMWQEVGDTKTGDGESISYSFVVSAANSNFTYHYAVVLYSGPHTPGQQSYFNISMVAGSTDTIACAAYQVDATSAATIGGFSVVDSIYWKPWSSVVVPLYNYIGQTVTITFTTRGCIPNGCAGKHFAYAYISAECAPITFSASSISNCGQLDTLTAPAGFATYTWNGPGIVGSNTNQVVIIDQPGEYVVNLTTLGDVSCNFSLDTLIAGVDLKPNFTAPIACAGDSTAFFDLSTPAGVTAWSWDFGDGGTATTQNPIHIFDSVGTYSVTLTITEGPCTKDTSINISVSPPPTATFTVGTPVCEGTNSNFVYTGNAPPNYTYTWDFDGGMGRPVTGQGPLNISWEIPGTKTITLTVSNGSCISVPDTEQVVVKPFPGMTLTPFTVICFGDSTVLAAANATNYTWAPDPSLSALDTSTVIAAPTTTTIYSVTGTNTNCVSVDTVTVAVTPLPGATFTATGPVCIGQNATVTYTGNAGAGATYNWNFGGGTATPSSGQGPYQVNWLTPGTADISLTVTELGCDSTYSDTVSVYSTPPQPTITADTVLGCPGLEVCFTSSPLGNTIGYIWKFGDGGSSDLQDPCHVYSAPGAYTVSFQVALSPECIYDTSLTDLITVIPAPVARFTPSVSVIQQPQSLVSFTNQSLNSITYLWNFSAIGLYTDSIGSSTEVDPEFNFTQYGLYGITLYAYNQLGCVDTTQQTVTVQPPQNFYIPNVFAPNGNGTNDVFQVYLQEGATLLSFQVFDRWGEKVHDGLYPWDGTYRGKPSPDGVYVYQVNVHLIDMDKDVVSKGSVTLIR